MIKEVAPSEEGEVNDDVDDDESGSYEYGMVMSDEWIQKIASNPKLAKMFEEQAQQKLDAANARSKKPKPKRRKKTKQAERQRRGKN